MGRAGTRSGILWCVRDAQAVMLLVQCVVGCAGCVEDVVDDVDDNNIE